MSGTFGDDLAFASAIARDAGAIVDHVFVNFYYDIFPESKKILKDIGVELHHLATWWDILAVLKKQNYLPAQQIDEIERAFHKVSEYLARH